MPVPHMQLPISVLLTSPFVSAQYANIGSNCEVRNRSPLSYPLSLYIMGKASKKVKDSKRNKVQSHSHGFPTSRVPSATELRHATVTRSSTGLTMAQRETADVHIIGLKFNNDGTLLGKDWTAGPMVALYGLHHQNPSVWHTLIAKFTEYVKNQHEYEDRGLPKTLVDWQVAYDTKMVVNGPVPGEKDNVTAGKPWIAAWFTILDPQNLKDLITYLDGFVYWRTSGSSKEARTFPPGIPTIHISLPIELAGKIEFKTHDAGTTDRTISKDMECPFTLTFANSSEMVNVFATPPPFSNRYIVANIEGTATNRISIVWSGCLLPFKSAFETEGISLKSREVVQTRREYYRFVRDINISEDASWRYALSLFSDRVFACSPIVVKIVRAPEDDTIFKNFIQQLKLLINVHVEA